MTAFEELDPEARGFLEDLAAQVRATGREYEERRLEAGLPEPSGPPAIPPGTVVTATFVDLVDHGDGLGVDVQEHSLVWPESA